MNNNPDILRWDKNYQLKSEDFQCYPSYGHDAISRLSFNYDWKIENNGQEFWFTEIDCHAIFLKKESWIKDHRLNEQKLLNVLKHEQGHFDLQHEGATYFIQLFEEILKNKKFIHTSEPEKEASKLICSIYHTVSNQTHDKQEKYDDATSNGDDLEEQKKYNAKFLKLHQ